MSDDDSTTDTTERSTSPRALGVVLLGLGLGALATAVLTLRQRAQARGRHAPDTEQEMALRDQLPWDYETSTSVFAPAGAIAGHVHDVGGLPGLVGPLDGPPMDRVDWTEPGGARLRFQVHATKGGGPSDVRVQVARAPGGPAASLSSLEHEVRQALVALRKQMERA